MSDLRRRKQHRWATGAAAALLLLTACTSTAGPAVTVTNQVTVAGTATSTGRVDIPPSVSQAPGSSASPGTSTSTGTSRGSTAIATSTGGAAGSGPAYGIPPGVVVKTEPDGFKITKLKAGEKAPQFIVYSFDGVGWDEKWQYWFGNEQKVPLHFTGFLSGVYLLSDQTRTKYQGPGPDRKPGAASINFASAADLPVEIGNLNKAVYQGDEIGTHFVGHFCSDNPPGGKDWNTDDWNEELDQFFSLLKNVNVNNALPAATKLNLTAADIKGERTPCLEGRSADLFPALEAHNMVYDSSFQQDGHGLAWPTKSPDGKVWQMGMAQFPIHGSGKAQITMDYNFWYTQEPGSLASGNPPPAAKSQADSAQVLATYQDMLKAATTDGVNEPLILGNHFENWNNNAYTQALANFALQSCGKPGIYCVPFRDVVDWMNAQDPKVMAALQNHKSNLGGCPYLKWPHCEGLIQY